MDRMTGFRRPLATAAIPTFECYQQVRDKAVMPLRCRSAEVEKSKIHTFAPIRSGCNQLSGPIRRPPCASRRKSILAIGSRRQRKSRTPGTGANAAARPMRHKLHLRHSGNLNSGAIQRAWRSMCPYSENALGPSSTGAACKRSSPLYSADQVSAGQFLTERI